jgi:filamentous hemagglutinin family protein
MRTRETRASGGWRPSGRQPGAALPLVCAFAVTMIARADAQAILPRGGTVASGQVRIGTPTGNALTINQSSSKAIVDWNSFSVGPNASVNFVQPNSGAAILHRVTGTTPSTIAGQINANSQVFLVNPNGIAITSTGSVQIGGGFVASALDIGNADFNAGKLNFTSKGASAPVSNAGTSPARRDRLSA